MLLLAIYLVVLIAVIVFAVKMIEKISSQKHRQIGSILLWIVSVFLGFMIYSSVMKPINFEKSVNERYEIAVRKMLDIKKAQSGFRTVHGKYADSFEELVAFIENEKFAIVSRKDTVVIDHAKNSAFGITTDATGEGGFFKDIVLTETLGHISVKDSLFKNSDRYKKLSEVKFGELVVPVTLSTNYIYRNETKVPVFQAVIDKNLLLSDLDQDLVASENKVEGIDKINGDKIILGSLEEATISGNWPKKYGNNE